jgi:hypothetical protein
VCAQSLQSSAVPSWNHKLVSMKPKLEPVPEGGPATGGPLNLMPLTTAAGNGNDPHAMQLPPLSSSQPHNASEYVNLDSGGRGGLQGSLPSAGTLANQLQMTHVRSESQLAGLDGGGGSGRSIGLGAHPFQPDGMAGHGQQRWQQEVGVAAPWWSARPESGCENGSCTDSVTGHHVVTHAGWAINTHASTCEWQYGQRFVQVNRGVLTDCWAAAAALQVTWTAAAEYDLHHHGF